MVTTRGNWEVNVGDEVWVHISNRNWTLAKVEKIGSKLVHVRENSWKSTPYYLETGYRRDGYSGGFQTKAQRIDEERRSSVTKALRETFGIEPRAGRMNGWTTEALELLFDAAGEIANKLHIKIEN